MNCEHSQLLGCACYCGPRSHCPTIVNDNVSSDGCVSPACMRVLYTHLTVCLQSVLALVCTVSVCIRAVCVCVTRGDPVVSLLVQSRDNTLWRRCSLIIPFKRTQRNPSSHPFLLLLLLPSPPLPPPLPSTDAS